MVIYKTSFPLLQKYTYDSKIPSLSIVLLYDQINNAKNSLAALNQTFFIGRRKNSS
jgi:hypothetical protein